MQTRSQVVFYLPGILTVFHCLKVMHQLFLKEKEKKSILHGPIQFCQATLVTHRVLGEVMKRSAAPHICSRNVPHPAQYKHVRPRSAQVNGVVSIFLFLAQEVLGHSNL
jgi:hypothetical protein